MNPSEYRALRESNPDLFVFPVCGTGHRPGKIKHDRFKTISEMIKLAKVALREANPSLVISGMALGWDQALALAALDLGFPLVAAIPFLGQERVFTATDQKIYGEIVSSSTFTVIISDGDYEAWKMHRRNEWMVNNSLLVIALWDGSKGGTASCVQYATKKRVEICNLWPIFDEMLAAGSVR